MATKIAENGIPTCEAAFSAWNGVQWAEDMFTGFGYVITELTWCGDMGEGMVADAVALLAVPGRAA